MSFESEAADRIRDLNDRLARIEALDVPLTYGSVVWTDYSGTSTITGWSSLTTTQLNYIVRGGLIFVSFRLIGTSNSVDTTFTLPSTNGSGVAVSFPIRARDNGANTTGFAQLPNSSSTVTCYPTYAGTASNWTNTNQKIVMGQFFYII